MSLTTAQPYQPTCRTCGKPEHGSLACSIAPGWSVKPAVVASSDPDFVWRANVSGLLERITAELLALTEVVQKIAEKLAEGEASNQDTSRPD